MVNCWIVSETMEAAESQAPDAIADEDWRTTELEEAYEMTRETQADSEDN